MASGILLDGSGHREAELAVEAGCLEIMRLQHDLATSPLTSLLLDHSHQPRPVTLVAQAGRNEKITQKAGVAPAPAVSAADKAAVGSAQEQAEPLAVVNPGGLYVELVKPLLEQPDISRIGLSLDDQSRGLGGCHHVSPGATTGQAPWAKPRVGLIATWRGVTGSATLQTGWQSSR